jgi:hypothetical protein
MIIHHVKPSEIAQLEEMFGYETKAGTMLPPWLQDLQETALDTRCDEDFEPTKPEILEP